MKLASIMTTAIDFIGSSALVREAAELMGELDVGALPVGTAEALEGVLTDRDILYRVVAAGRDPAGLTVQDVMTAPVISCDADDTVQSTLDLMASHHIRRMPVLDARGRVVGWITLGDISRKLLVDSGALQAFMHELTEGA